MVNLLLAGSRIAFFTFLTIENERAKGCKLTLSLHDRSSEITISVEILIRVDRMQCDQSGLFIGLKATF